VLRLLVLELSLPLQLEETQMDKLLLTLFPLRDRAFNSPRVAMLKRRKDLPLV